MTLNLIFTHPRAFSLCIMQNVNISITTFFFFIMHAFSIRFLKLLFPIPFNWRSIKLTYRILEVLFIRSGCHFYSSKYFPNQWGQPDLSNLFKRRSGANCLQTCLYPVGQRVYCQWVDVRYLICSQFIIWVLFRQQGTVKRQSPIIIKEMRANRKCWLPGLIYNYEHLLIASSSSQYLTVCHAMRLSLVCTRLSSHWCKKKKWNRNLQSAHTSWRPAIYALSAESVLLWNPGFARATSSEMWLLVITVLEFNKTTRRSIAEDSNTTYPVDQPPYGLKMVYICYDIQP